MADGKIKISELDEALQLSDNAEFPYTQDNGGVLTTFKAPANQIARKVAEGSTFTNLETTAKTLVGAINELLSLGSPIIIGTTAPTSSQGANGNLYVQYTAGTGGADDEVDGIYVKIDGAWCEISTGGGSGTTDYEDLSNKPQVNSVELVGNKSLDDLGIMPASLSKTVSGSIAHFTDGADNIPVKSLVSQIVAVESGSGEKSPTNPYTISGFSQGDISVCGKNFYPIKFGAESVANNGSATHSNDNGTMVINTTSNSNFSGIYVTSNSYITKLLKLFNAKGITDIVISFEAVSNVSGNFAITSGSSTVFTIGTTPQRYYIKPTGTNFTIYGQSIDATLRISDLQIEINRETPTEYEQYNGNDYTFAFGQTVYGGHFDNKGNLVVTHIMLNFSDLNFDESNPSSHVFRGDYSGTYYSNMKFPPSITVATEDFTERYVAMAWQPISASDNGRFSLNDYGTLARFVFIDDNYSTQADFETARANDKIVVELKNPITLSITSQDIPTLLGENNIFSNTGDVEVDYYTDNADEIVELAKSTASTPLHNYSTDEQVVGTWIDGSTLYQKSFVFTSSLTITDDWVSTPFSISGLDKIIDGIIWRVSSGGSVYIDTNVDGDNIRISTKSKNTNFAIGSVLTIRYTKSST